MNLDVIAETQEEKEIEEYLKILHKSKEVHDFLNLMHKEAEKRNVFKFRARVKDVNSAIRTHRINGKSLDDVRDYIGVSFITNSEQEIYPIIEFLKQELPNGELIDFVAEENIYSPLVYIKWVPPLGYNILSKEPMIPNQKRVPIEVRVCSKEAYISEQSAYYSIQKNDTTNLPMEEKNNLRNIAQHITYKLALLNCRNLTKTETEKHYNELNELINKNKETIQKNNALIKDAVMDFGRLVYRCQYDKEISKDEEILSKRDIDDIDDKIKTDFCNYFEQCEGNIINKANNAVNKMCQIKYESLKQNIINLTEDI